MIRILYVASTLHRTGPTSQLFNIVRHLDRARFEPHLVTLSPEPQDSMADRFGGAGVRLHPLGLSRLSGLFLLAPRLRSKIDEIRPYLVHSHGVRGDMLVSGTSTPLVRTVHNFPRADYMTTYGRAYGAVLCHMHVAALRRPGAIVAVSAAVGRNLEQQFGLQDVNVIPNGVDIGRFVVPQAGERSALRQKLALPQNPRIWVSTGHLSARKNPQMLVRLWREQLSGLPDRLLLLGEGPQQDQCRALAHGDERIIFAGRVANVEQWLAASDYYVSASLAEGLPNAVLEALATGLPAALSDIGPHRDIVESAPGAGELFDPDAPASAQRAIERLLEANLPEMRSAARRAVELEFSAERMSQRYQSLYERLVTEAPQTGVRA